jgi:hypothetical protein
LAALAVTGNSKRYIFGSWQERYLLFFFLSFGEEGCCFFLTGEGLGGLGVCGRGRRPEAGGDAATSIFAGAGAQTLVPQQWVSLQGAPKDYRPIGLMHSFSKFFCEMPGEAFKRSVHDNFRSVQLSCRWLHCKKFAAVLLKVDIAKAFDSVV